MVCTPTQMTKIKNKPTASPTHWGCIKLQPVSNVGITNKLDFMTL